MLFTASPCSVDRRYHCAEPLQWHDWKVDVYLVYGELAHRQLVKRIEQNYISLGYSSWGLQLTISSPSGDETNCAWPCTSPPKCLHGPVLNYQ
jgi:hypothetical protein